MPVPNVVLISTDQQRWDAIGVEGRGVLTPNLDALCATGTRMRTCITPHPMCQPARASLLTGKLPYTHGVRDNGRDLAPEFAEQGLAGRFGAHGYRTAFVGKAHFTSQQTFAPTGSPECYSSAAQFPANWRGSYFGFDDVQLTLRPHHHARWVDPPEALHYERWLDQDGNGRQRWDLAKEHLPPETSHFQAWRSALEAPWHSTQWVGDRALEVLDEQGEAPLFAWISFPDPHPPFLAPKPWSDLHDPDEVVIAKNFELDLDQRPWWHRAFFESRERQPIGVEHAQGGVNWGARGRMSERDLREITAIYFGMVAAVDAQIGRIMQKLDEDGRLNNTIVVFVSDHGEWLGDHGLILKGPMLYDGLLRVPCIIAGPGIPAGRCIEDPVSLVDLRSTLMDLCELDGEPDDGASWRGLFDGTDRREYALAEYEVDASRSGADLDLRTVRTGQHRMSVDLLSGTGELYDLATDPGEMRNIFDDPAAAALRDRLMGMIRSRPPVTRPAAPRVGWH